MRLVTSAFGPERTWVAELTMSDHGGRAVLAVERSDVWRGPKAALVPEMTSRLSIAIVRQAMIGRCMRTSTSSGPYARQDALTDPGGFSALYDDLPVGPAALREVVSQLIMHVAWAARYVIPPNIAIPRETQSVADRLKLIQSIYPGSLLVLRPPEKRTFGTCRDYSLMICSMLRHHSIPARVRCGFATYFPWRPYEDHWICEYWAPEECRWVRTDAQLDQLQRDQLAINFDCADLPTGAFLSAGQAWLLARSGAAPASDFGHGDAKGLWFLRVNLYRDLLSLTNQQMSAWDMWRNATVAGKTVSDAEAAEDDRVAYATGMADRVADGVEDLWELAEGRQLAPWQG